MRLPKDVQFFLGISCNFIAPTLRVSDKSAYALFFSFCLTGIIGEKIIISENYPLRNCVNTMLSSKLSFTFRRYAMDHRWSKFPVIWQIMYFSRRKLSKSVFCSLSVFTQKQTKNFKNSAIQCFSKFLAKH